jgi:hypothetical protein
VSDRMMPGVRVTYDPLLPWEMADKIRFHVESNLDILPAWVISLYVTWDTEQEEGCTAAVEPNVSYRRALLRIGPKWPENNEAYRKEVIVHEFLHVHDWPFVVLAYELTNILEKNYDAPVLAAQLREQLNAAKEQICTDTTELVMRLLKRGDPASADDGPLESAITERDGPSTQQQTRRSHAQPDTSTTEARH